MAKSSNVFKRDKKWKGFVELPKDPVTGKRQRKWFTGNKEEDVKKLVNEWKRKVDQGYKEPKKIKLVDFLDNWLNIYCSSKSPTTVEGYRIYITKHMRPFFGNRLIGEVKPIHIQEFYKNELKSYSGKTVLQEHRILHKALNDALRNEYITSNPCDFVDAPKAKEKEINVYSEEEFIDLLNAVAGTPNELLIILAGMCGLRRSEVFGLKWGDIDFDKLSITVRQVAVVVSQLLTEKEIEALPESKKKRGVKTKKVVILKETKNTSSFRTFAFPESILSIFKAHRQHDDKLIFCKKDGSPENGGNFSHRFKNIIDKHEFKPITYHSLRHFNATMMLRYGIDTKIASKRLGHSTPAITQKIYQHVTKSMDNDAANKLDKILEINVSVANGLQSNKKDNR